MTTITVDPADLATIAELARRFGIGRTAMHNWRSRSTDFPAPVVDTGSVKLWSIAAVSAWVEANVGE